MRQPAAEARPACRGGPWGSPGQLAGRLGERGPPGRGRGNHVPVAPARNNRQPGAHCCSEAHGEPEPRVAAHGHYGCLCGGGSAFAPYSSRWRHYINLRSRKGFELSEVSVAFAPPETSAEP